MENIVKFPYRPRIGTRKPRRSKNGTPEERAAKAASATHQSAGTEIVEFPSRKSTIPPPSSVPIATGSPLRQLHSETLFALPFVTLPAVECASWAEFWDRATIWNDEPTEDASADYWRGRRYGREAVAATIADGATPRGLEIVVEHIIKRGFSRRGPAGRLCRQLSSAEHGFLTELCQIAVEAVRQKGMPDLR